ncbi:MAG: hypothetical protein LBT87_07910 [Treponema sp.]|jgi:hypothetical protein|nr:hypothetical protein [Treponema sp.]
MISLVFSTASLLFCGFFFLYFHRYIRRRTSRENILAECGDAVARLEAQIDAVTDRDAQLVEDRIRSLKKLLEDVDRRISLLSRIEDQRKYPLYNFLGNRVASPGAGPEKPLPASPDPGAPAPPPGARAVPEGAVPAGGPDAPFVLVPGPAGAPPPAPEPGEDTRPLVERAAELDRAGFSPELIASRLGVSVSEAELAVTVSRRSQPGGLPMRFG